MINRIFCVWLCALACTASTLNIHAEKPQEVVIVHELEGYLRHLVRTLVLKSSDRKIERTLANLSDVQRCKLHDALEQELLLLKHGMSSAGLNGKSSWFSRGLAGGIKGLFGGCLGICAGVLAAGAVITCFPGTMILLVGGECACPCYILGTLIEAAGIGGFVGTAAGVAHECCTNRDSKQCQQSIDRIEYVLAFLNQ